MTATLEVHTDKTSVSKRETCSARGHNDSHVKFRHIRTYAERCRQCEQLGRAVTSAEFHTGN